MQMASGLAFEDFPLVEKAQRIAPAIAGRRRKYDIEASFPVENFADAREAGLLVQALPARFGGRDAWLGPNMTEMYAVNEVIAASDPSFAQVLQVNNHGCGILSWHATVAQQERLLPDIAREGLLVGIAGSEAAVGATGNGTRSAELEETSDGWRLTTTKYFASLGAGATYYLVMAALPGRSPYNERQVFVLVPTDADGVSLENNWDTMGMRSTVSWTLRIQDLPVTSDQIIGEPGGWMRDPRSFTCGYIANHLGAADGAVRFVSDWIAARPAVQKSELARVALGDISSRVATLRAAFRTALASWASAASNAWDRAQCNAAELLSLQVLHAAKHESLYCISRAFEICGARSAFRDHPLDQLLRDTRTFSLHSRDDLFMLRVADANLDSTSFTVKGVNVAPDGVLGAPR